MSNRTSDQLVTDLLRYAEHYQGNVGECLRRAARKLELQREQLRELLRQGAEEQCAS